MIPLKNSFSRAVAAVLAFRRSTGLSSVARRRFRALSAVTARQRFGMASRAAALGRVFTAASLLGSSVTAFAANPSANYIWTSGDTTGKWSSTSTTTDWKTASPPLNVPGKTIGFDSVTKVSDAVTLDVNVTIAGTLSLFNSSGQNYSITGTAYTLTLDGTGVAAYTGTNGTIGNPFGTANVGFLNYSSSINNATINTNVALANTDAQIGASYGTTATANVAIGTAGTTTFNNLGNNGDGTTSHTVTFMGTEKAGYGVIVNSDIGTTGAPIVLSDVYNTGAVVLNGNLGPKVTSLTLNGTNNASVYLGAANANFTGTMAIQAGTLIANVATNAGALTLGATGTAGSLTLNGKTVTVTGLTSAGTASSQTIVGGTLGGGLIFTTGTTEFDGTISGASGTTLTVNSGTLTLNGAGNSYSGLTTINGGTLNINSEYALGGAVYGGLTFGASGGTLIYNSTLLSGATYDITQNSAATPVAKNVTLTGSATINTNGDSITFANAFGNGGAGAFTKAGAGTLTLNSTGTYTGATTVSGGTLKLGLASSTNPLSSSPSLTVSGGATLDVTGLSTGTLALSSGQVLGGSGTVNGGVTVGSGHVAPGAAGVGNIGVLTVSSLTLGSASQLDFDIASTTSLDQISVTNSGGLTINGGQFNINGGTAQLTTAGVYNLIGYSGAVNGTGVSSLTLNTANQSSADTYTFGLSGSYVTLTVASSGVTPDIYVPDADGNYSNSGNWSLNTVPNAVSAFAAFGGSGSTTLSANRTVTVDGAFTVGTLSFNSANGFGYTLASGGSGTGLTLNNGSTGSFITDAAGTHTIAAPLTLTANGATVTVAAATDLLTITGTVASDATGDVGLTKAGNGTLALAGANTYYGGTTLGAGTIQINSAQSLGDTSGALTFTGGTLQLLADVTTSRNYLDGGSSNAIIDTNGHTLTLNGTLAPAGAGTGGLIKKGAGTLVLNGSNTYTGGTTIQAGSIGLAADTGLGAVPGAAATSLTFDAGAGNTATLLAEAAFTLSANRSIVLNSGTGSFNTNGFNVTVPGVISGGAILQKDGAGTLTLSGTDTYTGGTVINTGTLQIGVAGALGSGDVNDGTSLDLNGLSPILGALNGAGTVDSSVAGTITLTVGNNNDSGTFSGSIKNSNGTLNLAKAGTGTEALTGANTYTGSTTVNGGILSIGTGGVVNAGALVTNGSSELLVNGGSFTASGTSTINQGGGLFLLSSGSATFANINGVSSGGDTFTIRVDGGTFTASGVSLSRNYSQTALPTVAGTNGFYVTGGTVALGTLTVGTSNSSASARFDGGSTTVSGAVSIGAHTSGTPRYDVLQVNGGSFTSTDTTNGIALDTTALSTNAELLLTAGVTTAEKIQFGTANTAAPGADSATLTLNGGTLYVGSGGLVQNATLNGGSFTSTINITGGTVGAKADWSTLLGMTLTNAPVFQTANAGGVGHNITLSGVLGGAGSLNTTGAGVLTLTGVDNYTGATTIAAGATLQLGDGTTGHDGTIATSTGITNNGTLIYDRFGNLSSPLAISGSGSVTVYGPGSQTLTGTSSYTGGTLIGNGSASSGTLFVNGSIGSNATPSGAVSVQGGGTLGGTGSLTVSSASVVGTVAPGAAAGATTGTLTLNATGGLSFSGTLLIALNSTGGVSSGTVLNTGALSLTSATLSLTGSAADGTTTYDLVNYTGTLGGDGVFANANIPSGYTINYTGSTFSATDIELDPTGGTAIPEPTTVLGGALLLGVASVSQRRRLKGLLIAA